MFREMGILLPEPRLPQEPHHAECTRRWVEERDKRSAAEQACHRAWLHIEVLQADLEQARDRGNSWKECALYSWGLVALAVIVAGVIFVVGHKGH